MIYYKYISEYEYSGWHYIKMQDRKGNIVTKKSADVIVDVVNSNIAFTNMRLNDEIDLERVASYYEQAKEKHIAGELLGVVPILDKYDNLISASEQGNNVNGNIYLYSCINKFKTGLKANNITIVGPKNTNGKFVLRGERNIYKIIAENTMVIKGNVRNDIALQGENLVVHGELEIESQIHFNNVEVDGELILSTVKADGLSCDNLVLDIHNKSNLLGDYLYAMLHNLTFDKSLKLLNISIEAKQVDIVYDIFSATTKMRAESPLYSGRMEVDAKALSTEEANVSEEAQSIFVEKFCTSINNKHNSLYQVKEMLILKSYIEPLIKIERLQEKMSRAISKELNSYENKDDLKTCLEELKKNLWSMHHV